MVAHVTRHQRINFPGPREVEFSSLARKERREGDCIIYIIFIIILKPNFHNYRNHRYEKERQKVRTYRNHIARHVSSFLRSQIFGDKPGIFTPHSLAVFTLPKVKAGNTELDL